MIEIAVALTTLLALGGHAVAPWRAAAGAAAGARTGGGSRSAWSLAALPVLLAAAAAVAAWVAGRPELIVAAAASPIEPAAGRWPGVALQGALLLAASVALGDLLLLLARQRLERRGWWLVGGLGIALLLAASVALELLRAGLGPTVPAAALLAAAGCRAALAAGAGEAIAPGRPVLAPFAAAALPGFWLSLPSGLRALLIEDGMLLTTAAAAVLFAAARWLPVRLRRPALAAAALLTAVLVARAGQLTALLPLDATVFLNAPSLS